MPSLTIISGSLLRLRSQHVKQPRCKPIRHVLTIRQYTIPINKIFHRFLIFRLFLQEITAPLMVSHELEYLQIYIRNRVKNRTQPRHVILFKTLRKCSTFSLVYYMPDQRGNINRIRFSGMVHKTLTIHINFSQPRRQTLEVLGILQR